MSYIADLRDAETAITKVENLAKIQQETISRLISRVQVLELEHDLLIKEISNLKEREKRLTMGLSSFGMEV